MEYPSNPHTCSCGNQYFVELERFETNGTRSPYPDEHGHVVSCPLCQAVWIYYRETGWQQHGHLAVKQLTLKIT